MPFKQCSAMDERIRFAIQASRGDRSLSAVCREFGISRPTGYVWLKRHRERGDILALTEQSRRPHRLPRMTATDVADRVVSLRLAYGWGARKLRVLLSEHGVVISESTVNRILARHGLQRQAEKVGQAHVRFERSEPNELWQMDFKGHYRLPVLPGGRCYPLSIIDDHSRYAIGLFALDNQQAATVHQALVNRFERFGLPEAILVDHGTPWWSPNGHGLTWLAVALIKQGIRLCFSGIRHPQTQGKGERFHRTVGEMVRHRGRPDTVHDWQTAFDEFLGEYNHLRPHEALDLAVPATRYRPSPRPYQPSPPGWDYPAGAIVIRLNQQGVLPYHRRRYFVCEALANEDVQVEVCDPRIFVRYRHMWIREIDLTTGRSGTLIDSNRNPYV